MKVLMVTNTYVPHVGGVARSVDSCRRMLEQLGHQVLVVTSTFAGAQADPQVIRVPSIEHFANSDFSFPLPFFGELRDRLAEFQPEVVHSHHPFLLGDAALEISAAWNTPVVFTHHTQYDKYAHYVAGNSQLAAHFIADLATGYCNLCDLVIAPSSTIAEVLKHRGVTVPIEVLPTGIDVELLQCGDGGRFRRQHGIPAQAYLVGHVGRLAHEKNLAFLAEAVCGFLATQEDAWFIVAGVGPSENEIRSAASRIGVSDRLVMVAVLPLEELSDLYASLDIFAFCSLSETQGLVVTEAMAAGTPVVAIDAPGVKDVVRHGVNGLLLDDPSVLQFTQAIEKHYGMNDVERRVWIQAVRETAAGLSIARTTARLVDCYLAAQSRTDDTADYRYGSWTSSVRQVEEKLSVWSNLARAMGRAMWGTLRGDEVAE